MAYTDDCGFEHAPEFKKDLAKHLAEIVVLDREEFGVRELTDILNGRDDNMSWDVTNLEVATALDKLVLIGLLEVVDANVDPGLRTYASIAEYDDMDVEAELEWLK